MFEYFRFRAGHWVEVKSKEEILATLDERGRLDGMPFMPELLQYCGKRFRIAHRAHKTCDTITKGVARSLPGSVHLEGLRCDGQAHGGCQAACNIYWKQAWLKPVGGPDAPTTKSAAPAPARAGRCDEAALQRATQKVAPGDAAGETRYACQATELLDFTRVQKWWHPRQYLLDLLSGNVALGRWVKYIGLGAFNRTMRLRWHWRQTPRVDPKLQGATPTETLDIKPGEWVRVRPAAEIMQTLNQGQRNRGLYFDVEMMPFCEKRFQVRSKVEKIIDERTGKMISLPGSCLILEGAACGGNYSHDRLFCSRAIFPYWREIWLRRDT